VLEQRLRTRNTDDAASIGKRMAKAMFELSFAENFDIIIVNDVLEGAIRQAVKSVTDFLIKSDGFSPQ
jgi:guanylate kinase